MDRSKWYLSGPITGEPDYMKKFEETERRLEREYRVSVINPARISAALPPDMTYEELISICERLIDKCEVIYLMPGWEKSKGCNYEAHYGRIHGKHLIDAESEK